MFATDQAVFVAAFREARASQPVDPAVVQPTVGTQAERAVFDVPPIVTRGPSAALFAACSIGSATLPDAPGFDRRESTSGFALYARKSLLSEGETATGPHLEFPAITSDASPSVATASVAIVAQP